MRIEFERSGGFMGLRQSVVVDTNNLEPQEADEITSMVEAANFFDMPEKPSEPFHASDQYQYRLTIKRSEETSHTVVLMDANAPESLQPLLQRLSMMARRRR